MHSGSRGNLIAIKPVIFKDYFIRENEANQVLISLYLHGAFISAVFRQLKDSFKPYSKIFTYPDSEENTSSFESLH